MQVSIVRQRVARYDVSDVLPFDEHVGLADGIGLVVQFLPEHGEPCLRVMLFEIFARDG